MIYDEDGYLFESFGNYPYEGCCGLRIRDYEIWHDGWRCCDVDD